jgi:hypothetical protein
MRKLFSIMLSVVILAAFVTSTAYAEDAKNIEFGQIEVPQGYAEAASHTPSYSFQLWIVTQAVTVSPGSPSYIAWLVVRLKSGSPGR